MSATSLITNSNDPGKSQNSSSASLQNDEPDIEAITVQMAYRLLEDATKDLKNQNDKIEKVNNLVYIGFGVIILMVAAMVFELIYFQIQQASDSNQQVETMLNTVNERISNPLNSSRY